MLSQPIRRSCSTSTMPSRSGLNRLLAAIPAPAATTTVPLNSWSCAISARAPPTAHPTLRRAATSSTPTRSRRWALPRQKLKRPGEWIVGALRATGVNPADIRPVMQAQNMLGEPLWRPPAPNGFADDDGTWLDGLAQRLDVANQFARMFGGGVDPKTVFEEALAPIASAETRQTIARAESRQQAIAL